MISNTSGLNKHLAYRLLLSTALAGFPLFAATAQNAADSPVRLAQAAQTYRFSIPAQPLPSAINAFSAVTGWEIGYPAGLGQGAGSPGVSGSLGAEEALRQLLSGTGLGYRLTGAGTVTLVPASDATVLQPITVQGQAVTVPPTAVIGNPPPVYAGGQVARGGQLGLLGNADIMDTPFNTTSYTSKTVQDQQARTIADVLDNDPSVRAVSSRGTYDSNFMIRGFSVNNDDIAYGGLYGILPRMITSAELAERIEVLKGPSTLLNGIDPSGSVGGTINLVPKRAGDEPLTQVTLNYMSDAQFGVATDIARRAGERNQYGLRFNGSYRSGDVSAYDQEQDFGLAVLGLDLRGEQVRLSFDIGHQRQDVQRPLPYITPSGAIPGAPDTSNSFIAPWAFAETNDTFGAVRGEVDVTDSITAYAAIGARRSNNTTLGGSLTVAPDGAISATSGSYIYSEFNTITGETGVRSSFETGPVGHQLNVAASAARIENGFTFFSLPANPASNLYDPTFGPEPDQSGFHDNALKTGEKNMQSLAVADTLSFMEDRILLTLGVRQQRISTKNFSYQTGAQSGSFNEQALSPAAGLVVKPWDNVSLYANYIEGLSPGGQAPSAASNRGEYLAPYKSEQKEIGVKVDHGSFATTLSLFEITKPSAFTNAAGVYAADGEQRNRGVEISTFGALTDDLRVLGGIALIDAEQVSTENGATDGNRPFGVPKVQANFGVEWDTFFDRNLTLTGKVLYTGAQYYDAANTQELPSWTRVDIGARYRLETRGVPVTLRANIENLLDEDYWAAAGGSFATLGLGAPRTFLLSASFDF